MEGSGFILLAVLILLLLPVVVAEWENRKAPDILYAAIALGGIAAAGVVHGGAAMAEAMIAGLACLITVAAAITFIRMRWHVRLLAGGHIKLLGAGATWLGTSGAIAMLLLAGLLFTIAIGVLRTRKKMFIRPEFAPIAALAILLVQLENILHNRP